MIDNGNSNSNSQSRDPYRKVKLHKTAADYAVIAICPVLIVVMLTALTHFLVLCVYRGDYTSRLMYIMFLFIVGATGIARISIEQGRSYAFGYAAALGAAAFIAINRFVAFSGPAAAISPIINTGLLLMIWWLADRVTFDCTVIDDADKASGSGLVDSRGLFGGIGSLGAKRKKSEPEDVALDGTSGVADGENSDSRSRKRKDKGHQPGRWVLYLAIAALPMFGLGQLMLPGFDTIRTGALRSLGLYLFATLTLLVTTSFLGLRRYLRQRGTEMPSQVSVAWLGGGAALIAGLLLLAFLLPMPGRMVASLQLPEWVTNPDNLKASKYGWGQEGAEQSNGAEPSTPQGHDSNPSSSSDSTSERQTNEPDGSGKPGSGQQGKESQENGGQKRSGEQGSGRQGESGKGDSRQENGGQKNENSGEKNSGEQSSGKQGEGGKKNEGQNSSGEQQGSKQQSESSQENGGQENSGDQESGKQGESRQSNERQNNDQPKGSGQQQSGEQNNNSQSQSQSGSQTESQQQSDSQTSQNNVDSQSSSSSWLPQLGSALTTLLKIVFAIVMIAIIAYFLYKNWDDIKAWWNDLLSRLRGEADDATPTSVESAALPTRTRRAFASFSNPLSGNVEPNQVIITSFQAFDAWARERGWPRGDEETPSEYVKRIAGNLGIVAQPAAKLVDAYNRIVYGASKATKSDIKSASELWSHMKKS